MPMRIQAFTLSIALTLLTAHALPLPAKGTYSVCTGSVCTKYGADYVLEAAQALTVDGDISVRSAGCLNACKSREHKAVAIYCGQKAVVDACADDATLALDLTVKSLKEAGVECEAIEAGIASKLKADALLAGGDYAAALAAYTEALAAAPAGFIEAETTAAAAMPFTAPAKLKGLPPTRRRAVIKKERERTTPGRARWLYEALVGRGRARLALGEKDGIADARAASALCPLDAAAWELLGEAATASGDESLAAEAAAEAEKRRPEA